MSNGSTLQVNPDVREAHLLRAWYDQTGRDANYTSLYEGRGGAGGGGGGAGGDAFRTLASVKDEQLARSKVRWWTRSRTCWHH
jgi:hypothetical protein